MRIFDFQKDDTSHEWRQSDDGHGIETEAITSATELIHLVRVCLSYTKAVLTFHKVKPLTEMLQKAAFFNVSDYSFRI